MLRESKLGAHGASARAAPSRVAPRAMNAAPAQGSRNTRTISSMRACALLCIFKHRSFVYVKGHLNPKSSTRNGANLTRLSTYLPWYYHTDTPLSTLRQPHTMAWQWLCSSATRQPTKRPSRLRSMRSPIVAAAKQTCALAAAAASPHGDADACAERYSRMARARRCASARESVVSSPRNVWWRKPTSGPAHVPSSARAPVVPACDDVEKRSCRHPNGFQWSTSCCRKLQRGSTSCSCVSVLRGACALMYAKEAMAQQMMKHDTRIMRLVAEQCLSPAAVARAVVAEGSAGQSDRGRRGWTSCAAPWVPPSCFPSGPTATWCKTSECRRSENLLR